MAISMVRKPSETPNITNIDDIIPFRYAYGNQSGYVISRGAEVSHTVNGNQFTINSGRLVLQGVESDIDANGVTLTIDSVSETRYYVVYYEINLATNTANIKLSNYSTTGYPTINSGDDLTSNSSGTARLPLYRFTAKSGAISGVEKVVKAIEYSGSALVGYDISKGTVEERLEKLGFNEGDAEIVNSNYITQCYFSQEGNSTFITLKVKNPKIEASNGDIAETVIAKLPNTFKNFNKDTTIITLTSKNYLSGIEIASVVMTFKIKTNNNIVMDIKTYQYATSSQATLSANSHSVNVSFLKSINKNISFVFNYNE